MAKPLLVFGCTAIAPAAIRARLDQEPYRVQCRMIVAATSKTAAARLMGLTMSEYNRTGCDTSNAVEIDVATSDPGSVFVGPLDGRVSADRFLKVD